MESRELRLRELIAEKLDVPISRVTTDADLMVDLGGDSLALAELVSLVESQIGHELPSNRLGDILTVGDLESLIDEVQTAD